MDVLVRDRDTLIGRIAAELDKPSVYMGGPSKRSLRLAEAVVRITDDHYRGAVEALEIAQAYIEARADEDDEVAQTVLYSIVRRLDNNV